MRSHEYKSTIRIIIRNVMRKKFPAIKLSQLEEAAKEISTSIHARFYGANVDGVGSPIWRRNDEGEPDKTAEELLNDKAV